MVGVIILGAVSQDHVRIGLAQQIDHQIALALVGVNHFIIDADPNGFNAALPLLEGAPPPPITDPANRAAFHEYVRSNNISPLGNLFSAYPYMTVIKILRCEQQ